MGYHKNEIVKGEIGEFSKIKEEFDELTDAHEQGLDVLEICEITDLIGAIEAYTIKKWNLNLSKLYLFSLKTKEAFEEGKR